MFDSRLRPLIDPPLNAGGRALARFGVSADQVTLIGFLIGLLAVPALWQGQYALALGLIVLNRLADGLDGAVARATAPSDRGGFLDICLDFLFYAAVPLGFALADPSQNALAAAVLLASFIGTGSSFLAFAIMAEKHQISTQAQGKKSIYYLEGLTEGAETIGCFVLMCLLPAWFVPLALVYAALCTITTATRLLRGWHTFAAIETHRS